MSNNAKIYLDRDTMLMLRVTRGDSIAYEKLYKKYFPIVIDYLISLDGYQKSPEDLAQEVFIRIWQRRTKYRPKAAVKTYFFAYAKNLMREKKSKTFRESLLDATEISELAWEPPLSKTITSDRETIKTIQKVIAKFPTQQRRAFELVYIGGFSIAETAKILNCSVESVYSSLYRARKRLREIKDHLLR